MIRAVGDALMSVLLAPCCACCSEPLTSPTNGPVCDRCWAAIPPTTGPLCAVCGDAVTWWRADLNDGRCSRCARRPRVIACGRSIGPYDGSLREILQALKYSGRRSLAAPLGELMRQAGADVLRGADFVVPVPLHVFREYSRGFNQAYELASNLGLPVRKVLRRTRVTVTQTDLPEAQRHANVRGAFAVSRAIPPDAVIVVVDDVSTTGATLDACAQVLLDAGAKEVRALTAARAAARLP